MPKALTKWKVKMSSQQGLSPGQLEPGPVKANGAGIKTQKSTKQHKRKSISPKASKSGSGDEKVLEVDTPVLEKYKILERLGKGAYGIVWEAVELRTERRVALKKIFDAFRNNMDAQRTYREIYFLLQFGKHPNIINLIGGHQAQNDMDFYLCFPLMTTDLHKIIKTNPERLGTKEIRTVLYQISKAILYIHSANVIHRDVKPANVLLDTNFNVKLADFGLARSMSSSDSGMGDGHPEMTDYVATRWYRPPEVLLSCRRYSKSIDIWGLACVLAEMLNKKALFPGANTIEQIELVIGTIEQPTRDELERITSSTSMQSVVQAAMMSRKPAIGEIFKNQGSNVIDLMERALRFAPEKRLDIEDVLEHPLLKWDRNVWEEIRFERAVTPTLDERVRCSVETYRNTLYAMIEKGEMDSDRKLIAEKYMTFKERERNLEKKRISLIPVPSRSKSNKLLGLDERGGSGDTWEQPIRKSLDENYDEIPYDIWDNVELDPQLTYEEIAESKQVHVKRKKTKALSREKLNFDPSEMEMNDALEIASVKSLKGRALKRDKITSSDYSEPKPLEHARLKREATFCGPIASRNDPETSGLFRHTDLKVKLRQMEMKLESMNLESCVNLDPEKGACSLTSMKPCRKDSRRPSTSYRSISDEILQSICNCSSKSTVKPQIEPLSPSEFLAFVDERPIGSRGKHPSTAENVRSYDIGHAYNETQNIVGRPNSRLDQESCSYPASVNYLDERPPRSRGQLSRGNQLHPERGSVLGTSIELEAKNKSTKTLNSSLQGFWKSEKKNAEREREKLRHSAYFPVIEFDSGTHQQRFQEVERPRKLNVSKAIPTREIQRSRIKEDSKMNNSPATFGLIRQEPIRIRKRATTRPRPTTQPQPREKSSLRIVEPVTKSYVRAYNYATISSKALDDLKTTFSHIGRY